MVHPMGIKFHVYFHLATNYIVAAWMDPEIWLRVLDGKWRTAWYGVHGKPTLTTVTPQYWGQTSW